MPAWQMPRGAGPLSHWRDVRRHSSMHARASAAFMCQEIDGPSSQQESRGLPHSRQAHPRSTPLTHIAGLWLSFGTGLAAEVLYLIGGVVACAVGVPAPAAARRGLGHAVSSPASAFRSCRGVGHGDITFHVSHALTTSGKPILIRATLPGSAFWSKTSSMPVKLSSEPPRKRARSPVPYSSRSSQGSTAVSVMMGLLSRY